MEQIQIKNMCECCGLDKDNCQEQQIDTNVSVYLCEDCKADIEAEAEYEEQYTEAED